MVRKRLFKNLAFFIISLCLLNLLALKFYWYFSIWYFDMPMHFLGGFCTTLVLIWLLSFKKEILDLDFNLISKIILGVLFIGISWEVFEILFNNIIAENPFNVLDTTSDVFFDLAGGILAIVYYLKNIISVGENNVQ